MRTPDHIRRTEAHARLERFGSEWLRDQSPEHAATLAALGIGVLDRRGLREAAEIVIVEVQTALLVLSGEEPLDARTANRLALDRYYALLALIEVSPSQKHAKQVQLDLTGGEPLSICTGEACRIHRRRERTLQSTFVAEPVKFSVKGCRRVFSDRVTMTGDMWPSFCTDCTERRKPHRDQERALKRKIDTMVRNPTVYVTTGDPPTTRSCRSGEEHPRR